jgi:small subunit ribosomal protein S1
VVVLGINKEKEEISLGMKQTEQNPWELVQENYPPSTVVVGRVRNLTSYGAFIEIEEGIDGLLHVSDMSWTRKVSHPSELMQKGDTVKTVVLDVDPEKRRVALGYKQLQEDPWEHEIPSRYHPGDLVRGVVTKLTSFGAFVELEEGLEGLLHISELSEQKIPSPEEIVDVGDVLDVRVIRVDTDNRKIGLSLRPEDEAVPEEEIPRIVLRSDQIEEADDSEQTLQEALEEAPQMQREPEPRPGAESTGAHSSLNIPTSLGRGAEETAAETEEAAEEAPVETEEPVEAEEAEAEPAETEPVAEEPVEAEEAEDVVEAAAEQADAETEAEAVAEAPETEPETEEAPEAPETEAEEDNA